MKSSLLCTVLLLTTAVPVLGARANRQAPNGPQIVQVRGDLYLVQRGKEATVFLVAGSDVILADPLDTSTARWLKRELATRFGGTVKYVIQSSHSPERDSGGAVFRDTAVLIGHPGFSKARHAADKSLPRSLKALDRNGDNRLGRDELAGHPLVSLFPDSDTDGDGSLTARELYSQVAYVQTSFGTRGRLEQSGKTIQFLNPGGAYRPESMALFFPEERVAFSAGLAATAQGPFLFNGAEPGDVLTLMHTLLALPFDTFISGSGELVSRADFVALATYLDAVREQVADGRRRDLSLQQIVATPMPAADRLALHEAGRAAQVRAIYPSLRVSRTDLDGSAAFAVLGRNAGYCESYTSCDSGGAVAGGIASVSIVGPRYGALLEFALEGDLTSRRRSALYDDEFAHRRSRASALFRYELRRGSERTLGLLVGPSMIGGDSRGVAHVKQGYAPFAGAHPIGERRYAMGLSGGAEIVWRIRPRLNLVVPVRLTWTPLTPIEEWPGKLEIQGGFGVSFSAVRHVAF